MKLLEIFARDVVPIKLAHIDDVSETLVIAGPNGVGKTRLIKGLLHYIQHLDVNANFYIRVHATSAAETKEWGKAELDTRQSGDVAILSGSLQKRRRRGKFKSSFLNFESDRSMQTVKPFNWDWNFIDPFEEEIGWDVGMTTLNSRFQDVIHSISRKIRSQQQAIAKHVQDLAKAREVALQDEELSPVDREKLEKSKIEIDPKRFPDPLLPFQEAFSQLLAPKVLTDPDIQKQLLNYRPEHGKPLPITELSSGEREVVTIVFDFLLRSPTDCIVIFDEPELHLHPELSYRLLQTLARTGERNQFIYCTHSAEIITASIRDTVAFIAPPKTDGTNQALIVREDDETHQALKLLGQSIGIISLGKRLVLIEGEEGSLDKQTYGAILKDKFPKLTLVPSGGRGILRSFSTLNDKVLAKTIWGVEFFMLCDRDALPLDDPNEIENKSAARMKLLDRYHLENYFLDERTIAKLFEPMTKEGDWLRSPARIRASLREVASAHVSYAAALLTTAYFREAIGNIDLMPSGCNGKSIAELVKLMTECSKNERARVSAHLDDATITKHIEDTMQKIEKSLEADTDVWKAMIPGRVIQGGFCSKTPLKYEALRTAYINAADAVPNNPFAEIFAIFAAFDRFK